MAKFTIVFHSVCGNTYQIADCFYRVLQERGQEVALYRTADASFESGERRSDEFKHLQAAIDAVPVIEEAAQVLGSDVLLLGSPTYYGCVSAQMKTFMDSFEKCGQMLPRPVCISAVLHRRETAAAGRSCVCR